MENRKNIRMLTEKTYNAILANTTSLLELAILSLLGLGMMRVSEVVAMQMEDHDIATGVVSKGSSKNSVTSWPLYGIVRYYVNMYIKSERDKLVSEAASAGEHVPAEMFIYRAKDGQIRSVNRRYIKTLFYRTLERAGINRDEVALSDLRRYGLCEGGICNAFFGTLRQSDAKKHVRYFIRKTEENV